MACPFTSTRTCHRLLIEFSLFSCASGSLYTVLMPEPVLKISEIEIEYRYSHIRFMSRLGSVTVTKVEKVR